MDTNRAVQLQAFEGPLDLLLSLISKSEIDIYDIPICEITNQYMQYLYTMNQLNMDVASEFIVMAAHLIEIKSKMMLPPEDEDETDELDPREELVRRLIEYKIFKHISEYIKSNEITYVKTISKDPEYFPQLKADNSALDISAQMLASAMRNLLIKHKIRVEDVPSAYTVDSESVSVNDKMIEISKLLELNKALNFFSLFENNLSKSQIVATFLAILELMKLNIVVLSQEDNYGDIVITKIQEENHGQ